jgi:hypothetical protein
VRNALQSFKGVALAAALERARGWELAVMARRDMVIRRIAEVAPGPRS